MLYTTGLLKRYVSLQVEPEDIARELTLKTCEVEEIHKRVLPDEVVIGKVTDKKQHPDADKLSVCQVDCGKKGSYQICCGATNVDKDMYVVVALPGCFLPAINLQIEPREMRGQASNGMICSKAELGIPEDLENKWIWILQHLTDSSIGDVDDIVENDLGKSLAEKYPWLASRTLDVDNKTITHRPDLFGHFGIATELEAIFPKKSTFSGGKKRRELFRETNIFEILDQATKSEHTLSVTSDKVESYTLLTLNNVKESVSDLYSRCIMHDLGLQPRSNWVDFSNMFMYLTGQPIHFFDANKIVGGIEVRQAKEGEKFTDLFEKEHLLVADDIVIADAEKIVALAGIVGSNNSGVDESTTDILVEIANFDDVQVRKTSMRIGVRTDAQVRFEKKIHPLYTLHMLPVFLEELEYFSKSIGGYSMGGLQRRVNEASTTKIATSISLDTLEVERMLFGGDGSDVHITDNEIAGILQALGFKIDKEWHVSVPIRRGPGDIESSIDLIEEIARIYGFDALPEIAYKDASVFRAFSTEVKQQRTLEELLAGRFHYTQIETYPWLHQRWIGLGDIDVSSLYSMRDLDSVEQKYMRDSLCWSLLENIEKNSHFSDRGFIFDIGKTRSTKRDIQEHVVLGCAARIKGNDWNTAAFLQLRSHIGDVVKKLGVRAKIAFTQGTSTLFHPKQYVIIEINNLPVGYIATVHPSLAQELKLPAGVEASIAELSLSLLQAAIPENQKNKKKYTTLQDQIVEKDLNFVLDKDVAYGSIIASIEKVKEIVHLEVFDLYQGEHIANDKKSIAVRIRIVNTADKDPLTTEEIGAIMTKAIQAAEKASATLR